MTINYNVTGTERKKLVQAIAQILECEVKYLGAPSFAFEVSSYHIDKNGVVQGEDNHELVADLCGLHDFMAISEDYDTPIPEIETVPDNVQIPYEAELGGRISPYRDFEEPPAYDNSESPSLTIEIPRTDFTDTALENLKRMVESKASLFENAFGVTPITLVITEDTIKFPWFQNRTDADTVKAYMHFITALCDMVRTLKRVNATEKASNNDKYAFRCFLLRLGFIGPEFKGERKILLSKLSGSSAFKNQTGGADDE